jgi:hypothetical protein
MTELIDEKTIHRGWLRVQPLLDDDVSINYVSDFFVIAPGESAEFRIEAGDRYYLYLTTIAATYEPNIYYEVIVDENLLEYRSTEPPSAIGDYRQVFVKPKVCKSVVVRLTNFGVLTRTMQVQIAGWKRHEDYVYILEKEFAEAREKTK